jgi:hypothetical protein
MQTILFSALAKQRIDKALIDAITLDIFGLQVVVKHTLYQVVNDDESVYYRDCLKAIHDDLSAFHLSRIYFHESLSFNPSLGLNDAPDKDIKLNQDFLPYSQQRLH